MEKLAMTMKTAVLFKCHSWDQVIQRSYERCKAHCPQADFYIFYDNSKGKVEIPENIREKENIFLAPYDDVKNLGLEWGDDSGHYGGYWYNGDYHQSLFIINNPNYDYVCSVENDVVVQADIDNIFLDMKMRNIDAVYKHVYSPNMYWAHTNNCEGYYDTSEHIHKGLFCISFFSRAALFQILKRRLEMSFLKREKGLSTWPIGEAVMSHEVVMAGMRTEELSYYCDILDQYDWAPAYLEKEIPSENQSTFIHPVTELNKKFIGSNLYQDYHSMISEEEISNGISRRRLRKVNDFQVYSIFFHHQRIYDNSVRREDVVLDARQLLQGIERDISLEGEKFDCEAILQQVSANSIQKVFAPLPDHDRAVSIYFEVASSLRLPLNVLKTYSVILAARDPNLTENFDVFIEDVDKRRHSQKINFVLQSGELRFYAINLPLGVDCVCIEQKGSDGFWINFMKILPTTETLRSIV